MFYFSCLSVVSIPTPFFFLLFPLFFFFCLLFPYSTSFSSIPLLLFSVSTSSLFIHSSIFVFISFLSPLRFLSSFPLFLYLFPPFFSPFFSISSSFRFVSSPLQSPLLSTSSLPLSLLFPSASSFPPPSPFLTLFPLFHFLQSPSFSSTPSPFPSLSSSFFLRGHLISSPSFSHHLPTHLCCSRLSPRSLPLTLTLPQHQHTSARRLWLSLPPYLLTALPDARCPPF